MSGELEAENSGFISHCSLLSPTLPQVVNFPPALYEYVTGELGLALVLVLNKVDLAPPALMVAWKHYFHQHYPQLTSFFSPLSLGISAPNRTLVVVSGQ